MKSAKWLTDPDDIPLAPDADLRRSLITSDGRGKEFKALVLKEIERRNGRCHHCLAAVSAWFRRLRKNG